MGEYAADLGKGEAGLLLNRFSVYLPRGLVFGRYASDKDEIARAHRFRIGPALMRRVAGFNFAEVAHRVLHFLSILCAAGVL